MRKKETQANKQRSKHLDNEEVIKTWRNKSTYHETQVLRHSCWFKKTRARKKARRAKKAWALSSKQSWLVKLVLWWHVLPGFAYGDFLFWAILKGLLGIIFIFFRVLKQIQVFES